VSAPASRFVARRRVEFADTDTGGIVHFARFFVYMETAEHLFLESLGLSVHEPAGPGVTLSWPRVAAACDYLVPARFGDHVDVHLAVERLGQTSVTYGFEFRRGDEVLARGRTVAVCCLLVPGEPPRPTAIPARFRERMAPAG
jgi:4-hydroxybenzoyl-CoA thioesterase/acyl-CoA thioester hydrolase